MSSGYWLLLRAPFSPARVLPLPVDEDTGGKRLSYKYRALFRDRLRYIPFLELVFPRKMAHLLHLFAVGESLMRAYWFDALAKCEGLMR